MTIQSLRPACAGSRILLSAGAGQAMVSAASSRTLRPSAISSHRLRRKYFRGYPAPIVHTRSFASESPASGTTGQTAPSGAPPGTKKDSAFEDAKRTIELADAQTSQPSGAATPPGSTTPESTSTPSYEWEDDLNFDIEKFTELPYTNFGVNQHMIINQEFKEALRQLLWKFRAPIRYAFAYGSGVFPQGKGGSATEAEIRAVHPKAPAAIQKAQDGSPKMIDFIFGVTHTQHWHSLNLTQHRDHYSGLGALGSGAVSWVQDKWGAGVYFNPYVNVDGVLIKYGVVNLDTLCRDLSEWDTLYLAGRLQKPVKILRDDPRVRLANQINLLSALRVALLLLPPSFTEHELYATIAGISYLGDPRMALPTENPRKVANIVGNNMQNFRRLYAPLVEALPNVIFDDPACSKPDWISNEEGVMRLRQDMDPVKRGNMVRRLPKAFRSKLYFEYQRKLKIPRREFNQMMEQTQNEDEKGAIRRQQGGGFERKIAMDQPEELRKEVSDTIRKTINWPSTSQSLKSGVTAGTRRTVKYLLEKMDKYREGKKAPPPEVKEKEKEKEKEKTETTEDKPEEKKA